MVRQHVSLAELQAFSLDGEPLSSAARQHFDGCPDCQQQVACSQQTTASLVARLYRSQCPSASTLSYYCLPNALTEEEQRQVTDHLANCPLCLAEFSETRQFLNPTG
jgi:hypothetical protein